MSSYVRCHGGRHELIDGAAIAGNLLNQPIASRLVKEIARYGGCIDKFVTPAVAADVKRHLEKEAGA